MVWLAYANAQEGAVNTNKPKMLCGVSQNGTVVGTGCYVCPVVDTQDHRRVERTSPIRLRKQNTVSP